MENIFFFTYCTSKHWRDDVVFLRCFGIFSISFISLCSLHGLKLCSCLSWRALSELLGSAVRVATSLSTSCTVRFTVTTPALLEVSIYASLLLASLLVFYAFVHYWRPRCPFACCALVVWMTEVWTLLLVFSPWSRRFLSMTSSCCVFVEVCFFCVVVQECLSFGVW